MSARRYNIDPKEVYTLELNKLRRCFSEISKLGEEVSKISKIGWRQVEYLRHMNFMLETAAQVGKMVVKQAV